MQRSIRLVKSAGSRIDQQDVHPPVVVVVEDGDPGSGRFRQVMLWRKTVVVNPCDSAFTGRNFAKDRTRGDGSKSNACEQKGYVTWPAPRPSHSRRFYKKCRLDLLRRPRSSSRPPRGTCELKTTLLPVVGAIQVDSGMANPISHHRMSQEWERRSDPHL